MSMIRDDLLAMLRCPEQRLPLTFADAALVESLNDAIRAGQLYNRGGQKLSAPIDGALVRSDGAIAYPVVDGIPVLLVDEGIALDQVSA